MSKRLPPLVEARPSETGTFVTAALVGLLVSYGVFPEETASNWIVVIGAVPALITSLVTYFERKNER